MNRDDGMLGYSASVNELSEELETALRSEHTITLSSRTIRVLDDALTDRIEGTQLPDTAEEVATHVRGRLREETDSTRTATLTGAEWQHAFGAIFTWPFDADGDIPDAETLVGATKEIENGVPEPLADHLRNIGTKVTDMMDAADRGEGDEAR